MNIPNEIALSAFLVGFIISLALWFYLLKFKLPQTGTAIREGVKKEAEGYIKQFKDDIKKELPDFETEITRIMKKQTPKLLDAVINDITDRIADPKEEKTNILMASMALQGVSAFRACMADPDFKQEFDSFIDGKMKKIGTQLEHRLPGILTKAAPEIKKAFMAGGKEGGGGGPGGLLKLFGIDMENLGGMFGGV